MGADLSRSGPIIAELEPVSGRRRFRVYHSPMMIREYFEDQLEPSEQPVDDSWSDLLAEGHFAAPPEFRARLTAYRLGNPQVDHIYSLRSARINFIPFQFKPLLRLLRADRQRLLIADDVGVGKTIEAGLILKELSTRQQLDRVLVLCPKALTTKWRTEMRRFDEEFRVLTSETLRYCLDEVNLSGEWPPEYARAIVHYQLFRLEKYLVGSDVRGRRHPGLLELDPPPHFDLVIADEAHHLRTPGTGSHRLMEHLCSTGEAMLLLSATPVQIHSDNLYTLLHLLRPDVFPDKSVFTSIVEPNRHITTAVKLLRSGAAAQEDWTAAALEAVRAAGETSWGRTVLQADTRFTEVLKRLQDGQLNDEQRVSSIHDLEELHSLAHIMNRTRRRDIERFTVRDPQTVSVEFTSEQRRLYDALLAFRTQVLLERYDPQVVRLILDTLERQAASCIHAIGPTLDRILADGGLSTADLTDDPEAEFEADADAKAGAFDVPVALRTRASELRDAAQQLPDDDPKLQRLLEIVAGTMENQAGPGKVLVFSFFLNTIGYMERQLRAAGVRVGVVTGRLHDDEREELRDRFRLHRTDVNAIEVLLSSEVGCEGLDYEFCDRLVNYDIPWNPMRIEQRIGRIDRYGQQSQKVTIFNFITPGTVEERVFFRCFDRLGVFRETVGDLEEVLGELVQDLNRIALDPALSEPQAEAQARQAADNIIRLADEQRRLDTQSADLLGLDDAFAAEVDDVVEGGRFIAEADLRLLVDGFLHAPPIEGRLTDRGSEVSILRLTEKGRRELVSSIRALGRTGHPWTSFVRALEERTEVALTFDQHTAVQRREIDFVTPVHPMAQAAARYWASREEPLVGGLSVVTEDVAPGPYLAIFEMWEMIAVQPDLRLVCLAASMSNGGFSRELSQDLVTLLPSARPLEGERSLDAGMVAGVLRQLDAVSDERRRETKGAREVTNELVLNRRLASLAGFRDSRRRRVAAELQSASEPRIVRMKTSELERIDADYERRSASLQSARRVEVLSERIAVALVEVRDAG